MSSSPPRVEHLEPGSRLGRYELLCPVAQGGMASVWLARLHGPHGFEKLVAIKTILPQYASDARFEQMFLDEARIASRIEHAHVARVLDLGEEAGTLFLVMEWVDGEALSKIQRTLERRGVAWPLGVVLRLIADACAGLHAAHELPGQDGSLLGVVHRDVSPQNILVTTHGVTKVIDFGIAKARGRLCEDTFAGSIKGKLQYMPPEQALGRPIDRSADVWAVGATLYYLLAGRPPLDADVPLETVQKLTDGTPPPPLPAHVPASVVAIVDRAMKLDPVERFGTAQEMQQAIEELMRAERLVTSAMDVERFLRQHLADRIENRRKAIDLAFGAAVDREHLRRLLFPTGEHATGVLVGGAYLKVLGPASSPTPSTPASAAQWTPVPEARVTRPSVPDLIVSRRSEARPTATVVAPVERLGPMELDPGDEDAGDPIELDRAGRRSCDPRELARLLDVDPVPFVDVVPPHSSGRRGPARAGARATAAQPPARPVAARPHGRWRGPVLAAGSLALLVALATSVAFEATSHGAFFRHDLAQLLAKDDGAARRARAEASTLLGYDTRDAGQAALAVLEAALDRSPADGALKAFTAHVAFAVELRFGRDARRHALGTSLLAKAPPSPLRDLAQGTLAALEGEPDARLRLARALVGEGAHEGRHVLAELALREGRREELEGHLAAIEGYSQRLEFLRARALATKDPAAARTRGEALAAQAPLHAGVRLLLARLAWDFDRDPARASRWCEQILALPPALSAPTERAAAETVRGRIWLARGQRAEARNAFDRAIEASEGLPPMDAELGLGEIALADGQPARAIAHFRSVLSTAPRHGPARLGLARGQIELGLFRDARGVLEPLTDDPAVGAEAATLKALATRHDARL